MGGAAPRTGPAGRLIALAGLAEDRHLSYGDVHFGLEGIELHEAVSIAVGQRDIRGSLRARNRVKRVHNRLSHNSNLLT